MSSTQHQLIEQCATRLRGIVEALDNIHDNTPHRWSTDLDDVHSSAESLLALINDQAPVRSEASFEEWLANELEGEDGQPVPAAVCDIALARRAFNHWPKLEHPAKVGGVRFSAGVSSRLVVEAAQRLYEFESTPEKEAERIERLQAFREQLDPLNLAPHAEAFNEAPDEALRPEQAEAERPEVVGYLATAEHPKHGQPHKAFNYFKDQHDAQVAHWRERGCEVSEDELMTVTQHARIVGALRADRDSWAEQAEQRLADWDEMRKERDAALARVAELTATRNRYGVDAHYFNKNLQRILRDFESFTTDELARSLIILAMVADEKVVAQAQHSVPEGWVQSLPLKDYQPCKPNEDRANGYVIPIYSRPVPVEEALRKLRAVLCDPVGNVVIDGSDGDREEVQRALGMLAAAPTQAQHSVPEKVRTLLSRAQCEIEHLAECLENVCEDEEDFDVREDVADGRVVAADIAHMLAAAPDKEVPQAWLDVQAERRRQVEAEGWTPEHDDQHADGQMAVAAGYYALACGFPHERDIALGHVPQYWPWDARWWKPKDARSNLVRSCALALAEIERLDRACISQSPQPGAATASS
ncbi:hypothetical protein ACWY5J_003800 [Pseudomonas aeruginosa]